ncbi:Endonuclease III conserved site-2 [Penicillium coprophilum]|uniref:Endonuclease III conserved site-2 n=1 Tax=Penicillium coprophilum TaxID=36646 RepID=UPI002394F14C|nr:Endonuclease III conserved site-2 [Penicillium coprophilum]KAJ5154708.1 Endonuclease III conserved site-2 [Penicillium coprophilum]
MRTSRTSRDTAKVLQALSPPIRRRTRNSHASALKSFAYNSNANATPIVKTEPENVSVKASLSAVRSDDESSLSEADTADIEDLLEPPPKRRKRSASLVNTRVLKQSASPRTPRKVIIKEDPDEKSTPAPKQRRLPARKTRDIDGSVKVEPPSNWEEMYEIVKKMRAANPTAPVDTMGCSELYWRASSPVDRRFQTLIALMLSSQTKDTVTAVAMQRLHTELGSSTATQDMRIKQEDAQDMKIKHEDDDSKPIDSTLNLTNILAVDPTRLNELIRTVGFHNNKTKYIKATALILRDQYDGDIPSTPEELMALPGVGPKMAYLCLSAAWGKHLGIGVDVHVHRITNLWGWNKTKTPEETRKALQSWLPREKWHEINKLLVGLGQTVCSPVKRRCGDCDLAGTRLCKSEIRGLEPTVVKVKRSPDIDEPKVKIEAV